MERGPLHQPSDYRLKPLMILIRKTGGDGNNVELTRHDDGTYTVIAQRNGRRHRRERAATVEAAVRGLAEEIMEDHRAEMAARRRERAEARAREGQP